MPNNTIELIVKTTDQASAGLKGIADQVDALGKSADLIKEVFAGVFAGFTVEKLVESITEAQTATNDLNRQFAQFGSNVGVSKDEMLDFADATAKATTLSNESLKEAQATLLNYTSLTGAAFVQARALVVDLAAKMGTDAANAAELLGRALQNPISGIRLLAQVGVTLTQQQRATIESLVQTGESAKAVSFIMAELQQRTQGAARELAGTLGGSLTNLKNSFAEAFQGQGADVAGLTDSIKGLSEIVQSSEFQEGAQNIVAAIVAIAGAAAHAVQDIQDLGRRLSELINGPQTEQGVLQQQKESLEELIAVPNQDPNAVNGYITQLNAVQTRLNALTAAANSANTALGGLNFGIESGDWDDDKPAKTPKLFDPLQLPIVPGSGKTAAFPQGRDRTASIGGAGTQSDVYANPFMPSDLMRQYLQETETDLDKDYDEYIKKVYANGQLVAAAAASGAPDLDNIIKKTNASNQDALGKYQQEQDQQLAFVQVSAKKLSEPLTDVEKEGQQVAASLTTAFEGFFQSGQLNGRNFAKAMIGFLEEILAKAASIDLVKALGIDKLFSLSSDAGNSSEFGGLLGAFGALFSGATSSNSGGSTDVSGGNSLVNAGLTAWLSGIGVATGGHVRGPGGPTTDSIPAWLSDGEFVVNAKSTSRPGVLPLLVAINAGSSKDLHSLMPQSPKTHKYADGGSVRGGDKTTHYAEHADRLEVVRIMPASIPKFAAGGRVYARGDHHTLNSLSFNAPTSIRKFAGGGHVAGDHYATNHASMTFIAPASVPKFAAGGQVWGPGTVHENEPSPVFPGTGGWSVGGQRAASIAGGGYGSSLVYSPQNTISLTTDDSAKSTAALLQFLTYQNAQQQAEFTRKLGRNGIKLK